jgi:hypothetical protein
MSQMTQNVFKTPLLISMDVAGINFPIAGLDNNGNNFRPGDFLCSDSFNDSYSRVRRVSISTSLPAVSEMTSTESRLKILTDFQVNVPTSLSYQASYNDYPQLTSNITENPPSNIIFNATNTGSRWVMLRGSGPLFFMRVSCSATCVHQGTGVEHEELLTMNALQHMHIKFAFVSKAKFNPNTHVGEKGI